MISLRSIQKAIEWSEAQFSGLPWRQARTLYTTAVSEFMLQQTVVGTVLKKFSPFILQFPNWEALANASEEDVVKAWEGLGYYRRARLLHKLAKHVVSNATNSKSADLPLDEKKLLDFPGIGPYTAQAILGIGANLPALSLDTNLQRVLARFFGMKNSFERKHMDHVWKDYFHRPAFAYRHFLEAMMDVGRVFCKERTADCQHCPLSKDCHAYKSKSPVAFGAKAKQKSPPQSVTLLRILIFNKKSEQMKLYQKQKEEWLSGQWELLTFSVGHSDESLSRQYPIVPSCFMSEKKPTHTYASTITRYKFQNLLYVLEENEWKKIVLNLKKTYSADSGLQAHLGRIINVSKEQLNSLHLSSATKKGMICVEKFMPPDFQSFAYLSHFS
jgi:A/G-specific adenine glycosylase